MVICHPPEFEILISTFTYAGHKQNYPPGIWKVEVFTNGYNNNIIKLSFDNEHCLWSNYQIFSHNMYKLHFGEMKMMFALYAELDIYSARSLKQHTVRR